MSAMWRAVRAIPELLAAEVGLTEDVIAVRLNVAAADVRQALGILYRQGKVDRCWTGTESYAVLPASIAAEAVSAA